MIGRHHRRVLNKVSSLKKGEKNLPLSFISSLTENIVNSQNDFIFCRYFSQRNRTQTNEILFIRLIFHAPIFVAYKGCDS